MPSRSWWVWRAGGRRRRGLCCQRLSSSLAASSLWSITSTFSPMMSYVMKLASPPCVPLIHMYLVVPAVPLLCAGLCLRPFDRHCGDGWAQGVCGGHTGLLQARSTLCLQEL